MVSRENRGASKVDALKLTEDLKRPLTPAHTLPAQNSAEKPIESKSHLTKEWESSPSSSQSGRGLAFEESDGFEQKALKWPNSLHYKNENKDVIILCCYVANDVSKVWSHQHCWSTKTWKQRYYQLAWLAETGENIK